jgi:hypothetical protein
MHEPSLPVDAAQNNHLKKKFLCLPMVTISISSRTLVLKPKFSEHLRKSPIETLPPTSACSLDQTLGNTDVSRASRGEPKQQFIYRLYSSGTEIYGELSPRVIWRFVKEVNHSVQAF